MFKVVTTKKVEEEIQKDVDQIPEVATLGLIGVTEDDTRRCACLIGKTSLRELIIMREQCRLLLDKIDSEIHEYIAITPELKEIIGDIAELSEVLYGRN